MKKDIKQIIAEDKSQQTEFKTQRTEIFEYPLPALREIVLNTIIHRDYTSPMDVQIKVFDQKITFFSPGELYGKQTIEALRTDDYQAYTRNKLIAEAFYLTGDIEKYGTSYTRIRKEIEDYPTMKFEFEEKPSAWLVTISYEEQKTEDNSELVTEHATKHATISRQYFSKAYINPSIKFGHCSNDLSRQTQRSQAKILPDRERKRSAKNVGSVELCSKKS